MSTQFQTRWSLAIVFAAIALASTAGLATAGTPPPPPPDSSTGTVGNFHWQTDSQVSPAGRCRYGFRIDGTYYNYLNRIGVYAPLAYARANRSTQKIGFRITVQRLGGTRWVNGRSSDWAYRTATPTSPAPFGAQGIDLPYVQGSAPAARTRAQLRWYSSDGHTIVGTATLYPDWYETTERGATSSSQPGRCGGTTG